MSFLVQFPVIASGTAGRKGASVPGVVPRKTTPHESGPGDMTTEPREIVADGRPARNVPLFPSP